MISMTFLLKIFINIPVLIIFQFSSPYPFFVDLSKNILIHSIILTIYIDLILLSIKSILGQYLKFGYMVSFIVFKHFTIFLWSVSYDYFTHDIELKYNPNLRSLILKKTTTSLYYDRFLMVLYRQSNP